MANITPAKGQILVKWLPENDMAEEPMQNSDGSVTMPISEAEPSMPYHEEPLKQLEVLSGPKAGQIALASEYTLSSPMPGATDVYFIDEASIKGYVDAPISSSSYSQGEPVDD